MVLKQLNESTMEFDWLDHDQSESVSTPQAFVKFSTCIRSIVKSMKIKYWLMKIQCSKIVKSCIGMRCAYRIGYVIGLPQLSQWISADFRFSNVIDRKLNGTTKDVANAIYVMQNARNQFGQEQQILPIRFFFRWQTKNVTIRSRVSCKNIVA